jgi:solute:Na+ symporter, SSS family
VNWIDYLIFLLYMAGILGIGYYHYRRNKTQDDYYVGGRTVPPTALGLSVVATDVGGGFSIGLGGVGFLMGLSGTWLLFTGLLGAWLSAVFIIPRIKGPDIKYNMLTYPDFLRFRYNNKVALVAAIISGIGYLLFTGSQILAGATLASATAFRNTSFAGLSPFMFSLYAMGIIIVIYTVMGGIKAVIYTDCLQWIILLVGLIFFALPLALREVGGMRALQDALPSSFFNLSPGAIHSVSSSGWVVFTNWMFTILPIWVVGMTLYQRMYACKGVHEARKAWYIAGVFEYPIMAFTGVILGMCARVLYPALGTNQAEMGLPMLINDILPIGVTGLVVAAYFSAIMSTADSCLMASSGNIVNDLIQRYIMPEAPHITMVRMAQAVTLILGIFAVIIAAQFRTVLDSILYAYSFLVSGLFIPTLGAFFWKRASATGALIAMVCGGGVTMLLIMLKTTQLLSMPFGLDPVVFGMAVSALTFVIGSYIFPQKNVRI